MNSTLKAGLLWIAIIVAVFLVWSLFQTTKSDLPTIPFSTFMDQVTQGNVESVFIRGDCDLRGWTRSTAPGGKHEFRAVIPCNYPPMYDLMRSKGVRIELEIARYSPLMTAVITWAPVLFLIGLWLFFMRQVKRRVSQTPPSGGGP